MPDQLPCANCGCPDSSKFKVWYYEGEGVCSEECHEQHAKLGCPFESSTNYRPCPHPLRSNMYAI